MTQHMTKAQQRALLNVYQRTPLGMTYLAFRRSVRPCFDGSGAVMVHWCGMWLGVELDGYTHS